MRGFFLVALVFGLLVGGTVAGVRAFTGRSSSPSARATPTAQPGSPQATAQQFASAWTADNLNGLYLLLDAASQHATSYPTFAADYRNYYDETTAGNLVAKVTGARDGTASLSVKVSTAYFGDLEYTITLNLVQGPAGWLVAWSPAAINPDMVDGRTFKSDIQKPTRGAILDRNGIQLAATKDIRYLGLNRSLITDRAATTSALVNFGFTEAQVDAAFNDPSGANQRVAVGVVTDDKRDAAAQLVAQVTGTLLYFQSQRIHPLGAAAAQVVGYTRELTAEELAKRAGQGLVVGDRTGAVGIEASEDKQLSGQAGGTLTIVAPDQTTVVRTVVSKPFVPGKDVKTTLDANVLVAAQARLGTRAGAAVTMDPQTNEILAINSNPSFDPDAFERNDQVALNALAAAPGNPQTNRATQGLYSAGSTFKLITGAAGLVDGGYTPTDEFPCPAVWYGLGQDQPRNNWEGGQGMLTISQGLMRSCNPVFYQIGLTLYNKTDGALSKMARLFGFGAPTGVVGIDEATGQVPDAAWKQKNKGQPWYAGDEVNLAIGQGDLLITPLQLANAYSTFFADSLRNPVLIQGEPATSRGTLPMTAAQNAALKLGLELVTGPNGTANTVFSLAGYTDFLGKSGTAEDAGVQQHVLFVAASPVATPAVVCAVVLDDGQYGSTEAGPIARDIVLAALK